MRKLDSLEAFRGVAALSVAVYHWAEFTIWRDNAVIDNFYLFVDFFFVLSGFIMAYVYRERITDGVSTIRYLFLRFARLYPVHIFMLAAFLGLETFKLLLDAFHLLPLRSPPFSVERVSGEAFASNLLLTQAFGQFEKLTWNETSWSISIEFYLYVAFAAICLGGVLKTALGRFCLGLSAVTVLFYLTTQGPTLDFYNHNAYGRGFVGFVAGIMLHSFISIDRVSKGLSVVKRRFGTGIEAAALVGVCLFLANAQGAASFAAPLVFFLFVFVFLDNQGRISRLFSGKAFVFLGALSYSIYMSHFLFCQPMRAVVEKFGIEAVATPATFAFPIFLTATFVFSYLMYRLIEMPTRDAMRRWMERRMPVRSGPAQATARA
ncbi:MAG: acyltransferase [Pseudomonadota bacterium]